MILTDIFSTRESLYVQRMNNEERERNLREASEETRYNDNANAVPDDNNNNKSIYIAP